MIQVVTFSDNVAALHATPDGLWLGHQGGVSFFDPKSCTAAKWTTAHGLPALPVQHIASAGSRLALATPNGVAWCEDRRRLLEQADGASTHKPWQRALETTEGAGVYVNGVAFVRDRIHATTGGGRIYLEGERGFQLLELPLPQARLLRVLPLPCSESQRRLIIVTNNSGVLLLATGVGEEPSLYQWGPDEGLGSRYVTCATSTGDYAIVGVHGGVHVAPIATLVTQPDEVRQWGRIVLADLQGPAEHTRVHSVCEHKEQLYIGTSVGLYRAATAELGHAVRDRVVANRVDEIPVRHLVGFEDELWAVRHNDLGQVVESSHHPAARPVETVPSESRHSDRSVRVPTPRITSYGRRWRFLVEDRWRPAGCEPECRSVVALCSTPEGIVTGGEAGRVAQLRGDVWRTEMVARPRRPPEVSSVAYDPDSGTLWAATRHGLFQRDTRGRWNRDVGFPGRTVHQLCVWKENLLALGSGGLHEYAQGAWSSITVDEVAPALFTAAPSAAALALAGRPGSGFWLWNDGEPRPQRTDLQLGRANCMAWGTPGELWLGTDRGLVRWNGSSIDKWTWESEAADHVAAVLVHRDKIYVGSQAGVWVVAVAELQSQRGAAVASIGSRLGLLDGLPNPHVTALIVHQDRVWVGTRAGLAVLA